MRKIRSAEHLTDEESAELTEVSENRQQFRRRQAICLIQTQGLSSTQVAEIVKVSADTVLQRVFLYNNKGEQALIFKGSGGRRRCHMTYEEEISFLGESEKEAEKGVVITAKTVKCRAEEKSGHEVSEDYACDLLHRHQRKKKSPRPCRPKGDKSIQEEYKKNSRIRLKKQRKPSGRMMKGL